MKQVVEPVDIYSGAVWEAGMVKSLLEDAVIEAFLKDENIGTLAPWCSVPGRAGSVKVVVSSLNYDLARAIVREYEKTMR